MRPISFKEYLSLISEDAASDVAKIQGDIANLDAMINQRTATLITQKQRLQKMLAVKQKQREAEESKLKTNINNNTAPENQQAMNTNNNSQSLSQH